MEAFDDDGGDEGAGVKSAEGVCAGSGWGEVFGVGGA